ncbi:MAG: HAMP domain-containing sensor histidine kinase [Pseudomonadota bacterium]
MTTMNKTALDNKNTAINDARWTADELDERQRIEAISALAGGIAHEINTPIQFISDNLIYLRNAVNDTSSDMLEAIEESLEGVEQIRDIVVLMKDFASSGSGDVDRTDLNDIIQNVAKVCRGRDRDVFSIKMELDAALPMVQCRRAQIQQVITNILVNAIDAVEGYATGESSICIRSERIDDEVRICFSDRGPGISENIREKIFHPFFTTKPTGAGTGNGLSLAKDVVVKGHGGRLCLGKRNGYATTFVLALPIDNMLLTVNQ